VADTLDHQVRLAAFEFLERLSPGGEVVVLRDALEAGFHFRGRRVPLVGPQGIFKPALLTEVPLSITTAPVKPGRPRPYEDSYEGGVIRYKYRGVDPRHHDNVGLRRALERQAPLVYFHGIEPGRYVATWPVFVVGDDPLGLTFSVSVDDRRTLQLPSPVAVEESETPARRRYITRAVVQRLHQQDFRARVLRAYQSCCAVCRLRHEELLDAAHILPDHHPLGEPQVSNGLALCKIHHAAFDQQFLGIRPDLVVEIRSDLLKEKDGPMLRHGLQELHGQPLLVVPRSKGSRPNPVHLEERYLLFQRAG
jgi:putative restriction endonuclease